MDLDSFQHDTPILSEAMRAQITAREAEILGHPLRIPPLERDSVAEAAHASTKRLRKVAFDNAPDLPLEDIPAIIMSVLRYPVLWESICQLSIHLMGPDAVLPKRDRQLAVLRTLWLCQAPYPWGEHVKHGKAMGLTSAEIDRITQGSTAPEWTDYERALLCAAEELHSNALISDATWNVLHTQLDTHQLFELTVIIGQFNTVAYFENTMRFRLEKGNIGLAAR